MFAKVYLLLDTCALRQLTDLIVQEDFKKYLSELLNMNEFFFTDLIVQEDGVVFREESSGNNERIGQYRLPTINSTTLKHKQIDQTKQFCLQIFSKFSPQLH